MNEPEPLAALLARTSHLVADEPVVCGCGRIGGVRVDGKCSKCLGVGR